MSLLAKNLAAIKNNYGIKEEEIEKRAQEVAQRYELITARTGEYGLINRSEDGDSTIHSKYDPLREAARIVDSIANVDKADIIVVYGFGLGYHVEILAQRLNKHQQVFIVEPTDGPGVLALKTRDLKKLLSNSQVHLLITDSPKIASSLFNAIIDIKRDSEFSFYFFAPQDRLYRELFKEIHQSLVDVVDFSRMQESTMKEIGFDVLESSLLNLKSYLNNPGIKETFEKFKNVPAFIIAAGPSLNKNVDLLKKVKDKGIIIAVGTAVRTLQLHGVEPDIVIAIDPQIPNYDIFKDLTFKDTMLALDLQTNYKILDKFNERKFMFTGINNPIKGWLNPFHEDNESVLISGGSVANTACCLAHRMGCDPIVFVGQDLCLAEDGHTHAFGTVYEKDKLETEKFMLVDGNNGGKVRTLTHWYCFLQWFENFIKSNSVRKYINATEGGARIKGTEILSLNQVISKYCNTKIEVQKELLTIWNKSQANDLVNTKAVEMLEEKIKELDNICNKIKKARVSLVNIERQAGKMNRHLQEKLIKQIGAINKFLDDSKEFFIVGQVDYRIVADTIRKTYAGDRNEDDDFFAAAKDTIAFYEAMLESTSKFRKVLEIAQQRLIGDEEYGAK